MKLTQHWVELEKLQEYLDKFEEKIKFIIHWEQYNPNIECRDRLLLIIDEE